MAVPDTRRLSLSVRPSLKAASHNLDGGRRVGGARAAGRVGGARGAAGGAGGTRRGLDGAARSPPSALGSPAPEAEPEEHDGAWTSS
jgi:hypothetical protein